MIAAFFSLALLVPMFSSAVDNAAATEAFQIKPGTAAPAFVGTDLLSTILEHCPLRVRRIFLESFSFIGDQVASSESGAILECLDKVPLVHLTERIARAGSPGHAGHPPVLEHLFSSCSESVRNAFYDRLIFRDGRLVSMFVGGIQRCADKRDLPRFLSLFGVDGLQNADWRQPLSHIRHRRRDPKGPRLGSHAAGLRQKGRKST